MKWSHHHHAGDQKRYVESGHEHVGRIIETSHRCRRRPAQGRETDTVPRRNQGFEHANTRDEEA